MDKDVIAGDCVLDASVGIKLFLSEEGSEQADRLFDRLAHQPAIQFYVPDLFYVECTNILWKYVRSYGYPAENARQDVTDLQALRMQIVSTADLIRSALELALAYDITAYDASYAALAQGLELPLVTADATLARKLYGSAVMVKPLREI